MINITSLAFVAFPVNDIKIARHFYEEILGLKMSHNFMEEWIEYNLGDTALAITKADAQHPTPVRGAMVALEVKDINAFVRQLKTAGVQFSQDLMDTPVCRIAILQDPDGNPLMLHEKKRV